MSEITTLLAAEISSRADEIAGYELNIDRFERMLNRIAALPWWHPLRRYAFRHLRPRLRSERLQHSIACLSRDVALEQMEAR